MKRERKGAMRELKRDAIFLEHVKTQKVKDKAADRCVRVCCTTRDGQPKGFLVWGDPRTHVLSSSPWKHGIGPSPHVYGDLKHGTRSCILCDVFSLVKEHTPHSSFKS